MTKAAWQNEAKLLSMKPNCQNEAIYRFEPVAKRQADPERSRWVAPGDGNMARLKG
jgi:hypothetical protein